MPKAQLRYLTDELEKLREQKLYQKLRVLETEQLPVSRFDGHEVINLSSNNYLGLTTHPKLRARALEATRSGAWAPAPCAPSPAPWRSTWNWRRRSRGSSTWKRRWSFSRDSPPTPERCRHSGARRHHHLGRTQSCLHHRWLPAVARGNQGLPAQGHGGVRKDSGGDCRPQVPQAADYRRRVLHGRRYRPAAATGANWPKSTAAS